ncbi:uncharacterized protein LOC111693655 [Trichogramma pretiosum]|uniref:uncharacterized protein LOC111693655 n=1 Tax=Trichogramma pretiosum TaxID=7493 RepID=UPI000C71B6F1|nr:uncharacterized protein LOC111693655 [Trichogramma pretiosum]
MVILFDSNIYGAARMLVAYTCAMIAFMCICVPSQLMSNASNDFFTQGYCTNWYNYRPSMRINLMFIMTRAIKTFEARAGPMIDMNFESFSEVMKRSVSFIAAFRSLYAAYREKQRV